MVQFQRRPPLLTSWPRCHSAEASPGRTSRRWKAGRSRPSPMAALAAPASRARRSSQASSGDEARVTASMRALPMMTPSASARDARPPAPASRCRTRPRAARRCASRRRARSAGSFGADLGAGAGHAGHGDAVDERGGRGGHQVEPLVGARRRRHRHERDAGAGGQRRQPAGLARERRRSGRAASSSGQVGDHQRLHAGAGRAREEPLRAVRQHRVERT